jgi:hypothetical protein
MSGDREPLTARKKLVFWAGLLLLVTAFSEVSFRLYLAHTHRISFFRPSTLMNRMYRQLGACETSGANHDEEGAVILLLGGSPLHPTHGTIEKELSERLSALGLLSHRICNLSAPGHTTRDSYLKYSAIGRAAFDAVVVYHGINEVRANNCPPEVFDDTYSHYTWYEERNRVHRHLRWMSATVIPFLLEYVTAHLRNAVLKPPRVPIYAPRPEWVRHGSEVKTTGAFRRNLEEIIRIARGRGESVLVLSFAYYIPRRYTRRRFHAGELDYDSSLFPEATTVRAPVELWGDRWNVAEGLWMHNWAIDGVVKDNPDVRFLDMSRIIPAEGAYFRDVCHLSQKGCALFAEELGEAIAGMLAGRGLDASGKPHR